MVNKGGIRMFFFKRKDPICGMKEEKGKGIEKNGKWFCSENCAEKFSTNPKVEEHKHGGCCCH